MIRTTQHYKLDEEARLLEDIEQGLLEEVRYLWKRTREMAGHDGFQDMVDEETGEMYYGGCDCNVWNRIELKNAIRRLRSFRAGIYQAY